MGFRIGPEIVKKTSGSIVLAQLILKQLKNKTWYIPALTNIGLYVEGGSAVLIDSGNDQEAGRQINKLLTERGWNLTLIVNTHSNADHIGGNAFLQSKTGCRIASTRAEAAFVETPLLEPSFLYGGYPSKELRNKFLMAKESKVTDIIGAFPNAETIDVPADSAASESFNPVQFAGTQLEAVSLPGHYFGMIGIRTPDNVFFTADSVFPARVIDKYHLFYIFDAAAFLSTLDYLAAAEAELFVPSHGVPAGKEEFVEVIKANRNKVREISDVIAGFISDGGSGAGFDDILAHVCAHYRIALDINQYVLVGNTLRSHLMYLYGQKRLRYEFEGGRMRWFDCDDI